MDAAGGLAGKGAGLVEMSALGNKHVCLDIMVKISPHPNHENYHPISMRLDVSFMRALDLVTRMCRAVGQWERAALRAAQAGAKEAK